MRIEQQIVERWDRGVVDAVLFPEGKPDTSEDLRFRLGESQNWRCCYCGVVMNRRRNAPELCTIEHVIPASAGGWKCWETCVAACKRCNEIGGKAIWREGWERRLSVPLCPRCGTDNIRFVGRRAIRCNLCARQFSTETTNGHPFAPNYILDTTATKPSILNGVTGRAGGCERNDRGSLQRNQWTAIMRQMRSDDPEIYPMASSERMGENA